MTFREIDGGLWDIIKKYLSPTKPHIGRPRCDPRQLINGILYVLATGCTGHDVPEKYGTKSTVHRYHLELCEKGVHQAFFLDLLQSGYAIRKTRIIRDFPDRKLQGSSRVDLSHYSTDTRDIPTEKGNPRVLMAIRR